MEKLVYALWKRPDEKIDDFRLHLLGETAPRLLEAGARRLRLSVADVQAGLERSMPVRQEQTERVAAIAPLWLDDPDARDPIERALAAAAPRFAGYLVDETIPRWYDDRPDEERTPGVSLVSFLVPNPKLSHAEFMHEWQDVHTALSLEVHPLWCYVRNAVRRALTPGAPPWAGIVEEHFRRIEDVTDPARLYGSRENARRVLEHVQKFLDLPALETSLMSEWVIRSPTP